MKRLFLLYLLGGAACNDAVPYELSADDVRVFAENRCRATADCCQTATVADCTSALTSKILDYQTLTTANLTFSENCLSAVVEWSPKIDCGTEVDLGGPGCVLARGDRELGDPCIAVGDLGFFITDCADGLQCLLGRCVDDPFWVTQRAQEGESCDPYTWCEVGLFCSDAGICQVLAEPGMRCSQRGECGPIQDFYCRAYSSGNGECVPKASLGESCEPADSACELDCNTKDCEQLICTKGVCALPGPAVCDPH